MKLENTLDIPVPVEEAWPVLLDLERIAPCVPGATLASRDGDSFHGRVKVKLGPIGAAYTGSVTIVSRDEEAKVAVLEAAGRETRGGGTAKARVTCTLTGHDGGTTVLVETDLAITGRPAQFGRGVLADVAATIIGRFAENLAAEIAPRADAPPAPGTAPTSGPPTTSDPPTTTDRASAPARREAEPIDLLGATDPRHLRLVVPAAALAGLLVGLAVARRRGSRS